MPPPLVIPFAEVLEFHAEHCRLDRIHTGVPAELGMDVALRAAMIPQSPHMVGGRRIVRGHQPGIAIRAQVLGGVKAERSRDSHASCFFGVPFGADGLRRILDQHHIMLRRNLAQGVHVCALAVEMDRQDSLDSSLRSMLAGWFASCRVYSRRTWGLA